MLGRENPSPAHLSKSQYTSSMYPPNMINSCSSIRSSPSSSTLAAGSPHSSLSSSFSSSARVWDSSPCGGGADYDQARNPSLSSAYSPPSQSGGLHLSPSSPTAGGTMEQQQSGAVMSNISSHSYFHSHQEQQQLPSLYQVATMHDPDDDDGAIAAALCGTRGGTEGADANRTRLPAAGGASGSCSRVIRVETGGGGSLCSPEIDVGGGGGGDCIGGSEHGGGLLQYAESAFSDYHHHHHHHNNHQNHHLVDASIANHPSSRQQFMSHEPMLTGNSSRGGGIEPGTPGQDSALALNSSSPSASSSFRRLPLQLQSPAHQIQPQDFLPQQIRNARRTSSSSIASTGAQAPTAGAYGAGVLDAVLSPVVDGCHGHQQPFPWYPNPEVGVMDFGWGVL